LTSTWSEKPIKVCGSYEIFLCPVFVNIKSMQDRSEPLEKVWQAAGPGCKPFNIYHPCISHCSISQGALAFLKVSSLSLGMVVSSMVGDRLPMRAFQSPQTTVRSSFGKQLIMSST
jgi:hypothetical protein